MSPTAPATVDIWFARTADLQEALLAKTFDVLLLPDEKTKRDRFIFERHQDEYVVTRAMMRLVLATYFDGVDAMKLEFERTKYGRPLLRGTHVANVCFNLANSVDFVVCAVTQDGREIGVDTEPLSRADQVLGVAEAVFSGRERMLLESPARAATKHRDAVRLWTLKEAYMKARGLGLSLPADQFEMDVIDDDRALMHPLNAKIIDESDPSRWSFATHQIDEHLVSTCVASAAHVDNEVPLLHIRRADLNQLMANRQRSD